MESLGTYRFVVREYSDIEYFHGKSFSREAVGIGIENIETKIVLPSPITKFIKSVYRRKHGSISTQRNPAYEIVKFLNFIIKQINMGHEDFAYLKGTGLFGLGLVHGAKYISYLSLKASEGEIDGQYVFRIERYLIQFYQWLNKQDIIFEPVNYESGTGSPFDDIELGTIYPRKQKVIPEKLVDFGENRIELAIKFLRIAENVAPEIALGIAFQFFGGLRVGEVVNMTKRSIEYPSYASEDDGSDKFIVRVRDNQGILFGNRISKIHEQVKRPRNQSLLVHPVLSSMYINHKKRLQYLARGGNISNHHALFVSSSTGNAISGKRYYEKFMKVKEAFLLQLSKEERINDYDYLTRKRWSTHICRGVFTNFLLDIGASVTQVAIARGDKSIMAVLEYVEETNAIKITQDAINKIRISYENEEARISDRSISQWKEGTIRGKSNTKD